MDSVLRPDPLGFLFRPLNRLEKSSQRADRIKFGATYGWAPFGKFGIATDRGTAIRQTNTLGLAQVHPFARSGDMFGASFSYAEPNRTGRHHESVFESFYRVRLTRSIGLGPDLEISTHPTYAREAYTTAVLGMRLEIVF